MSDTVYLYDTTLRDGAQTRGVDFSAADKRKVAQWLDDFGFDYIEGGWPGANPTDDEFFAAPNPCRSARLAAFGMTCRTGVKACEDASLAALIQSAAPSLCLVGKASILHATKALGITAEENLRLIRESLAHAKSCGKEVLFDAEHFFDGFALDDGYALEVLRTAFEAGASWLVLCDTNGGSLPHEIEATVRHVREALPTASLGIHAHNDTGNAVASSLAAVRAGCRMVQGTLGGLGERCGNADLLTLIPILSTKMGMALNLDADRMKGLVDLSNRFAALLDRDVPSSTPFVGAAAFAHKGGLHASAVAKDPKLYEQMPPESVGNRREILVSNQAGLSNLREQLRSFDIDFDESRDDLPSLLARVKDKHRQGFAYDRAGASFALLALRHFGEAPENFSILSCAVHEIGTPALSGDLEMSSYASVKLEIDGASFDAVAEGNGPVHALDQALRQALGKVYPEIDQVRLTDYHVRILNSKAATGAAIRVLLESEDASEGASWTTVGVSTNVINASLQALCDSYRYRLCRERKRMAA
jgi:2-isopropylmalate synthase